MFSEATAAHPYSQRANIELGAHETGFLLGWIPATVANDAAAGAAAPAPVGGALLHQAERRPRAPRLRARAPPRDRRPDPRPLRAARHPRRAAAGIRAGARAPSCTSRSTTTTTWRCSRWRVPGADLEQAIAAERHHLFHRRGLDAIYVDLPLEHAGDRPRRRPPRAARRLLRRGLPQPPHRRRRAADAVAAPGPSQGRRHCRRLGPRARAARLRPRRPAGRASALGPRPRPRARRGGCRPCA